MIRRPKPVSRMTVVEFENTFPNEDACRAYLQARRWPAGVRCPRCGNDRVFPVKSMPFKWQCCACVRKGGYRFSVIVGTIFENTNKPLRDWFRIVHYMLASNKGMTPLQIHHMGFGKYETAHSMYHKIRAGLRKPEAKLGGIVEAVEALRRRQRQQLHIISGESATLRGATGDFTGGEAVQRRGNATRASTTTSKRKR